MNSSYNEQEQLIALGNRSYMPNYKPRGLVLERGAGSIIWDADGKEYIDFGTGIGVNCLGHQDPEIVDAVVSQIKHLWHTSNIYFSKPPVHLADSLIKHTFAEKVYFCNSGAEANEAAIKIARKFASDSDSPIEKRTILTFEGSFHGRTIGALAATAQPKYQEGFGPLPGGFRYCAFNDVQMLENQFDTNVCAVLIEPIQGESGIKPATEEFLMRIQELCRRHDALLIFDEVQCGMGRTGKMFAYEWVEGLAPDVVTISKALGGGLPIGAVLAGTKVADVLGYGSHGSTFGGNPVCCAAASVVLNRIANPCFMDEVHRKGNIIRTTLTQASSLSGIIHEIRGKGMMVGIELTHDCSFDASEVMTQSGINGLLVLQAGVRVVRLLPALTISDQDLARGLEILVKTLAELSKTNYS